ncbi:ZIP family metal transporter [Ornithinicoccus halotolerans]|uniref:ZIP family metal transporter n=1 Tax=Ornithinicoccus halotolerans TaxID=1748220 RepID=UPI0012976C8B|nr:ZIP family metal transporter [Ornithinicoccus halotolerans]
MGAAFLAAVVGGAATVLGGACALHPRMRRRGPLAIALAFAAGIMVVLSFVEILPLAHESLISHGVASPRLWVLAAFVVGALLVLLADRLLPAADGPGPPGPAGDTGPAVGSPALLRSGVLLALIVTAHNLPEGMAAFLAMLHDPALGATLVLAIAIHNLPEGAAVAAPVYAATGSRTRALAWAGISGAAEPVGALLGYLALRAVLPAELVVLALALVAGMMVLISVRQLLPTARRYQTRWSDTPVGFGVGAGLIWISLQLG